MLRTAARFGLALIYVGAAGVALAVDLPATGQTTSYPANRNDGLAGVVPVPDDGALQAGATPSFTDNGDGTITDTNTGLMWEKKGDNGGLHDKDNAYYWSGSGSVFQETVWDWIEDVNAEGGTGLAGYNDWRIPNAKEMHTLVHFQSTPPMTFGAFHVGCVPGVSALAGSCTPVANYWTSTTRAGSTSQAWSVSFYEGLLDAGQIKGAALRVRAVRGGSPTFPATGQTTSYTADKADGIPGPVAVPDDGSLRAGAALSFTDNGDGTLTDNNTGLVWEKKGDNFGLHDKDNGYWWSGNGVEETLWDWIEDLNAEGGLGFAAARDWRIPNERELLSIADFQSTWALPAQFRSPCFPGATHLTGSCAFQSAYWSSTTRLSSIVAGTSIEAWYLSNSGAVYPYFKSTNFRARAVRGGTP